MEKIFNTGYSDLIVTHIEQLGNEFYSIRLNRIEETIVHKSKIYLQAYKQFDDIIYCINDIKVDKNSYELVRSILRKS